MVGTYELRWVILAGRPLQRQSNGLEGITTMASTMSWPQARLFRLLVSLTLAFLIELNPARS
jgi:hypothetical protein